MLISDVCYSIWSRIDFSRNGKKQPIEKNEKSKVTKLEQYVFLDICFCNSAGFVIGHLCISSTSFSVIDGNSKNCYTVSDLKMSKHWSAIFYVLGLMSHEHWRWRYSTRSAAGNNKGTENYRTLSTVKKLRYNNKKTKKQPAKNSNAKKLIQRQYETLSSPIEPQYNVNCTSLNWKILHNNSKSLFWREHETSRKQTPYN